MSLLQNINKKTLMIVITVIAVLVGGIGVSFALSALPDPKNDGPTPTIPVVVPVQDSIITTDTTVAANPATIGEPPAASISGGIGGDDDDDDDHDEDEGDDDGDDD